MRGIRTLTICVAAALCSLAALGATTAQASVERYPEPAYTKTSGNNSYWFRWTAIKGFNGVTGGDDYRYYLCANTYHNGTQEEFHNGSAGPGAANCSNLLVSSPWSTPPSGDFRWQPYQSGTVLQDGHTYSMCSTGFHFYGFIWAIDNTSTGNCVGSTIDRNAPQIQAAVNGDQTVTNNPQLQFSIAYQDATSPPWFGQNGVASNWTCVSLNAPCQPGGQPDNDCSVPQVANSRNNAFHCQANVAQHPDGDWYFCARSADAAVPDNPNGPNQAGTSNQANLSGVACGHVVLDRAAPSVTANASATTAPVGTLINFSGQASDPSGVEQSYDWDFGDNTPHAAGANATHTYTQPGTYQARLTVRDNAGNVGVATRTITITPAGSGTGGGGGGGGGGTTVPGTQNGTTGVTPTQNQVTPEVIVQQNGSNGAQSTSVGNLDVIAPRTFTAGRKNLVLALTPDTAGKLQVTLLRGSKIVARKGAVFGAGGTYALRLRVPAKIKPGIYRLKLSYTPDGAPRAQQKTLRVKVVRGKKGRGKAVVITEEGSEPEGIAASRHQPRRPRR